MLTLRVIMLVLKNVVKMAGLEMSDLKDLGYDAVKEIYSKQ